MKVIPFQVPKTAREAFRLQVDHRPHFYDKLHQHPETQIMLIVKGEGTLISGDYVGRFSSGDLFVIGSNQPHVFRNDDNYYRRNEKKMAHAISIYFDENYAGPSFWQLNELKAIRDLLKQSAYGLKIEGKTKLEATQIIHHLLREKGIDKLISFLRLLRILSVSKELQQLSVRALPSVYRVSEEKRMNDILQFTFKESARPIYLEEVAELANLSVEAFCRYFKLRTQKTYTSFLNEVRVSKASQLLIQSDKSIQDVCFESGFTNLSNFNRVFRKVTGKTPRNYIHSMLPR